MKNSTVNVIMAHFRLKNETVQSWALREGHKPDTVYKVIHGIRGKSNRGESAVIKQKLVAQGYWPADTLDQEGEASS